MNWENLIGNLDQYTLDGITKGSVYALVALGYTMVYGVLKLINFAHSEVFMVGTWTVLGVYSVLGLTDNEPVSTVIWASLLALVCAVIASASTALSVERLAYRPLRKKNAPPLIFLITGIGCSLVLVELFGQVFNFLFGPPFGRTKIAAPAIWEREVAFNIGRLEVFNDQVVIIVGAIAMMIVLDTFVNKSRLGRGVRAVAQDPDTASLMGINKERVIMLVFILGGAMAGVAALLYMIRFDQTKFDIGFIIGVKAFTAAVLGGIGNLRGALLGGLLLGIVESFASGLWDSSWTDVTAFTVLVLVLMLRPTGILGESLGKARA